jgi:hypothetical protein
MSTTAPTTAIGDVVITSRPFADYTAQLALNTQDLLAGARPGLPRRGQRLRRHPAPPGRNSRQRPPLLPGEPLAPDRSGRTRPGPGPPLDSNAARPLPRDEASQWSHAQ